MWGDVEMLCTTIITVYKQFWDLFYSMERPFLHCWFQAFPGMLRKMVQTKVPLVWNWESSTYNGCCLLHARPPLLNSWKNSRERWSGACLHKRLGRGVCAYFECKRDTAKTIGLGFLCLFFLFLFFKINPNIVVVSVPLRINPQKYCWIMITHE